MNITFVWQRAYWKHLEDFCRIQEDSDLDATRDQLMFTLPISQSDTRYSPRSQTMYVNQTTTATPTPGVEDFHP